MAATGMRVISINLRKRLGDGSTQAVFARWVATFDPDVVIAQEPTVRDDGLPPVLAQGLVLRAGDHRVACWVRDGLAERSRLAPVPAVLLEVNDWCVCGTYLSSRSPGERVAQLTALRTLLLGQSKPVLLAGDFNLAPTAADGRYGDAESRWTGQGERVALQALMMDLDLIDLTSVERLGAQHFTFERLNKQKWNRFRCDLALGRGDVDIRAAYDHTVRLGSHAFTDHSACVIDMAPVRPTGPRRVSGSTAPVGAPSREPPTSIHPHRTAISRRSASRPAQELHRTGLLRTWQVRSILDFGCGHGRDVAFFRGLGYLADGYDPHAPFGYSVRPDRQYDLVMLVFVLNVLESALDRLCAIREASRHLADRGRLLIVTRSAKQIGREAEARAWPAHGDGFLSNPQRGMFQHGLSQTELEALVETAGLVGRPAVRLDLLGSTYLVAARPEGYRGHAVQQPT